MSAPRLLTYILVMAGTTWLIRVLPLVLFRREIKNPFLRSFLFYIPYACLAAMTWPEILWATNSRVSSVAGFVTAVALALRKKSLLTVALAACLAVFLTERILMVLP